MEYPYKNLNSFKYINFTNSVAEQGSFMITQMTMVVKVVITVNTLRILTKTSQFYNPQLGENFTNGDSWNW